MGVSAAWGSDLGGKVKVELLSGCGQMMPEVVSHKHCVKQPY